jgi:predicted NUDIX family NTP pyrophosphohydrolase
VKIRPLRAGEAMKFSAAILLFRHKDSFLEVFLVHPGGPFWTKKDAGAWSLPKGEYLKEEDPLSAAKRELKEETSLSVDGEFLPLGEVQQSSGKRVTAWALEYDFDPIQIKSNLFTLEWPPKSGRTQEFPEVDGGAWFSLPAANDKLVPGQRPFLTRLSEKLAALGDSSAKT